MAGDLPETAAAAQAFLIRTLFPASPTDLPTLLTLDLHPPAAQLQQIFTTLIQAERILRILPVTHQAQMYRALTNLFECVYPLRSFHTSVNDSEEYFFDGSVFAGQLGELAALDPIFEDFYKKIAPRAPDASTFSTVMAFGLSNVVYLPVEKPNWSSLPRPGADRQGIPEMVTVFAAAYSRVRDMVATDGTGGR